jgi:hypothetical protein
MYTEERRQKISENREMRRIYGSKRDKVNRGLEKTT